MEVDIDVTKPDIEDSLNIPEKRKPLLTSVAVDIATRSKVNAADVKEMLRHANNINEALILMFSLGVTIMMARGVK